MDLLAFARGPALAIFALGRLWRLLGILRRPVRRDLTRAPG